VGISFNGEIGEVRLWNISLSDEQVANNIESDFTGVEQGLIGLWNMNTDEDQNATDLSTGALAVLGNSQSVDSADPSWILNTTCSFSMFHVSNKKENGSARIKEFIYGAMPVIDSLKENVSQLKTFPNPAANEINIYVKSDQTTSMTLEIMDSFGNLMFRQEGCRTNEAIKVTNEWKAGIYIARAFYNGKVDETKIVRIE
jgi:hypothetical protein